MCGCGCGGCPCAHNYIQYIGVADIQSLICCNSRLSEYLVHKKLCSWVMVDKVAVNFTYIPYIRKYWRSLNLAICLKSGSNALLVEFEFGGLLHYVIA